MIKSKRLDRMRRLLRLVTKVNDSLDSDELEEFEAQLRQLQGRVRHQCGAECDQHDEIGGIG